jgi:pimeloyl-ACP methyl ester carboxylesterase
MTAAWLTVSMSALLGVSACKFADVDSAKPFSVSDARGQLRELEQGDKASPGAAQRPLVILGGWRDPGIFKARLASTMWDLAGEESVLTVSFFLEGSFAACRDRVVSAVQERWPSDDPTTTVEVDVIAHSMGGLVARYSALASGTGNFEATEMPVGRRLRIANLCTVATPHRGARLAPLFYWDRTARDMIAGSDFLRVLDGQLATASYRLVPYVIAGDTIVGSHQSAPFDTSPRTFPRRFLMPSHLNAMNDPRVVLDIAHELKLAPQR